MSSSPEEEAGDASLALSAKEFDAFYKTHGAALWRYLLRSTCEEALASDVFQEALFRFLRSAPRELEAGKRRAYVFRIASNLLRDAWRSRRQEDAWSEEDPEGNPGTENEGSGPLAADLVERIDLARDLERALLVLRPVERQLVWLAHVEGASHRELAETLGLREGSVKVMLFRARQKLAARLSPAAQAERDR